jgi:hypothetical protein
MRLVVLAFAFAGKHVALALQEGGLAQVIKGNCK